MSDTIEREDPDQCLRLSLDADFVEQQVQIPAGEPKLAATGMRAILREEVAQIEPTPLEHVPDALFGSAARFSGTQPLQITASRKVAETKDVTLEGWVRAEPGSPASPIMTAADNGGGLRVSLQQHGTWQIWMSDGEEEVTLDDLPAINDGQWHHLAVTVARVDPEQRRIIAYRDGVNVHERTVQMGGVSFQTLSVAGDGFTGLLRELGVFDRAMVGDEIRRKMRQGHSVLAHFRATHPIEFAFRNKDDEETLYIGDSRDLYLEITNTSTEAIELVPLTDVHTQYHFRLRFRPDVLSEVSRQKLVGPAAQAQSLGAGWHMRLGSDDGQMMDWIAFAWVGDRRREVWAQLLTELKGSPEEKKTWQATYDAAEKSAGELGGDRILARQSKRVWLFDIGAAAGGGGRGTRIGLQYDHLRYAGEAPLPEGMRSQFLNIVSRRGQQQIPLHAGFVGSNVVLNDGQTENELVFRITNTSPFSNPIPLALRAQDAAQPAELRVYFDYENQWRLTKAGDGGNANAIRIKTTDTTEGWKVEDPNSTTPRPVWFLHPPEGAVLDAQESITFRITNIKTDAATGLTNMYLQYQNIAGFWDGRIICTLEKSPVVTRRLSYEDDRSEYRGVGIGTDKPKSRLHVVAPAGREIPAAIFTGGHVGIGIDDPQAPLHVDGSIRTSLPYMETTAETFKVKGAISNWYPVAFHDQDWKGGGMILEIFRPHLHQDSHGRGSMMARIECHSSWWGHGSHYWTMRVRQEKHHFIGGWKNIYFAPWHVIWLKGDTTYSWRSNHPVSILRNDGAETTLNSGDMRDKLAVKTTADQAFNRPAYEIEQIGDSLVQDRTIPQGVIVAWSGSQADIPAGWKLCEELKDRFIVGAGGKYQPTNKGGLPRVRLGVNEMPPHSHTGVISSAGKHSHSFDVANFDWDSAIGRSGASDRTPFKQANTTTAGEHTHDITIYATGGGATHDNMPPYYALCFIIKL